MIRKRCYIGQAMSRLLLDIAPLRESPQFRRLWAGSTLSAIGTSLTGFAVSLQVYNLTRVAVRGGGDRPGAEHHDLVDHARHWSRAGRHHHRHLASRPARLLPH